MIIKLRKNIRFSKWMFCCIQEKWLKKIRYRYCCYVEWSDRQVTQSIAIPEYIRIPMDPHWNEWGSHFTVKAPNILLVYLVALLVYLGGFLYLMNFWKCLKKFFFFQLSAILTHWLPLTLIAVIRKYRFSPRFPIIFNNEKVENKTIDFWWLRQLISLSWKIAFFDFLYIFFLRGQNVPQNSHFTVIYRTLKVRYGKKI